MRNKIMIFFIVLVILFLLFGIIKKYKYELIQYFAWKYKIIDTNCFNRLLKAKAENNLIARPEFLLDKEGNFKCVDIGFFLKKFNVEIDKIEPITIYGCRGYSAIDGCKVNGKWQLKGKKKNLTVYFYLCNAIEDKKEKKYFKENPDKLLNKKTDAIEVIGDNDYYEIYGKLWWIDNKNDYDRFSLIIEEVGESYSVTSEFTGKELLLLNKEGKDKKKICTSFQKLKASFYGFWVDFLHLF